MQKSKWLASRPGLSTSWSVDYKWLFDPKIFYTFSVELFLALIESGFCHGVESSVLDERLSLTRKFDL